MLLAEAQVILKALSIVSLVLMASYNILKILTDTENSSLSVAALVMIFTIALYVCNV